MQKSILVTLLFASACASHPPPTDHLASAIAATRGAQEAGAANVPKAALQLKLAEEGVARARSLMESDENERADFMTLRAYNDAELAIAIAREDAARKRSQQATALATSTEQAR